jgi:hypothetical protein
MSASRFARRLSLPAAVVLAPALILTLSLASLQADTGTCTGASRTLPFVDVPGASLFFCAIGQAYFAGLTAGTSPTTYNPSDAVTRDQMAAFLNRTMDQSLKRGSRRAILQQFWTPTLSAAVRPANLGTGDSPQNVVFDGADLWVANYVSDTVSRVRASDGRLLQTWTGAEGAIGVIACAGRIFVTGNTSPGQIYVIDPESPIAGPVTVFEPSVGSSPSEITFDGTFLWTANHQSISRVHVATNSDVTFTEGFQFPEDILWDGTNLWVVDQLMGLLRIDRVTGAVLESVPLDSNPLRVLFDGTNLWVSGFANSVTIVRAVGGLRGTVLQTLTGNGLSTPMARR